MPTPGFPDWVCVGAVVRPTRARAYGLRFVIIRIEFQPSTFPERDAGAYAIALNPLLNADATVALDQEAGPSTVNLPMLLDHYEWTGEYMDENEQIIGVGTTMPVTMFASGMAPGDEVVITGSQGHDGVYRVGYAHQQHVMLNRDHEPVTPEVEDQIQREMVEQLDPDWAMHHVEVEEVPSNGPAAIAEADDATVDPTNAGFEAAREWMQQLAQGRVPADVPPPPLVMGLLPVDPDEMDQVVAQAGILLGTDTPESPTIAAGQVWLLPAPNTGLWRIANAGPLNLRLDHARERDRRMTCTRAWLTQHGTRHEPPDPRARTTATQPIAKGQVWEIRPENTKYTTSKNRLWRVQTVDERAGQILLVAEDGSGKRLYWTSTRLLAAGTFAGDGLPRRTAFEHVLADELDDDA